MKKLLATTGAAVAVAGLVALGTVSPAMADVTVIAPIQTADTGAGSSGRGYGAAVSNDGSLAAAAMEYGGVTIYNVASGAKADVSMTTLGSTDIGMVTFSPDNTYLYVADYDNSEIDVVKTSDGTIARSIALTFSPWTLEASRDGAYLYAAAYSTGGYYRITLSDDSLSTVAATSDWSYPSSMCLSADGSTLYAPNYSDGIDVITTSDMSVNTRTVSGASQLYSCELDNDGNLVVGDYGNSQVLKISSADGTILESSVDLDALQSTYVYSAVPSCDKIYVVDENNEASVPVLDLATLDVGTTIVPDETPSGEGFFGYNGDRSIDGSVIAISGYYATDGLVIIQSPECASASASLPDTGVDTSTTGISVAVAAGMLVAGAIALVAIRRRKA